MVSPNHFKTDLRLLNSIWPAWLTRGWPWIQWLSDCAERQGLTEACVPYLKQEGAARPGAGQELRQVIVSLDTRGGGGDRGESQRQGWPPGRADPRPSWQVTLSLLLLSRLSPPAAPWTMESSREQPQAHPKNTVLDLYRHFIVYSYTVNA